MSNQPKESSHVLRNIVIILLIIAGSFGLLYYAITTDDVVMDDPAALAAQPPMPASRRFTFDAASETAQIRLDKSDLWWLMLPGMGESFLEDVNRELENYQLNVTGCGFNITEKGVFLDLEAMYQDLRLPVHVLTSLDFDESGVSLTISKVKLGPLPLPVASLLRSFNVRIDADWPVITDITDVSYQQDAVLVTGSLTQDMLPCMQEARKNDAIGWFSTSHQVIFRAAKAADGFRELLPALEQEPGFIEDLYHDVFTLAQDYEYEDFMESSRNLSYRFFPGINYTALKAENDSVQTEWKNYDAIVDKLVTRVSADFNNRRIKLKNGEFNLRNAAFDPLNYFTDDTAAQMQDLFNVIDPDKFHLVLVGAINGYDVNSPALNRVCSTEQQLTKELNRNEAYPVGCIFQGKNGEYFLRYESMKLEGTGNKISKWLKTVTLSGADYQSLIQEGKIGVWIS